MVAVGAIELNLTGNNVRKRSTSMNEKEKTIFSSPSLSLSLFLLCRIVFLLCMCFSFFSFISKDIRFTVIERTRTIQKRRRKKRIETREKKRRREKHVYAEATTYTLQSKCMYRYEWHCNMSFFYWLEKQATSSNIQILFNYHQFLTWWKRRRKGREKKRRKKTKKFLSFQGKR